MSTQAPPSRIAMTSIFARCDVGSGKGVEAETAEVGLVGSGCSAHAAELKAMRVSSIGRSIEPSAQGLTGPYAVRFGLSVRVRGLARGGAGFSSGLGSLTVHS